MFICFFQKHNIFPIKFLRGYAAYFFAAFFAAFAAFFFHFPAKKRQKCLVERIIFCTFISDNQCFMSFLSTSPQIKLLHLRTAGERWKKHCRNDKKRKN
jgi:hypothetical protein